MACVISSYLAGAEWSGEWEAAVALLPPTGTWTLETDLTTALTLGEWELSTRTLFDDTEWSLQSFTVETAFDAWDLESELRFEPDMRRFRDLITELKWSSDPWSLELTAKLTRTTDWLMLEAGYETSPIKLDVSFRLRAPSGACGFLFYDAGMELAFDVCGIEAEVEVDIDDDGFDELTLTLEEIAVPSMPWAQVDIEFEVDIAETDFEVSPEILLGLSWCEACIDLDLEGGFPKVPGLLPLTFVEFNLESDVGDFTFEATAYGDPADWVDDLYWLETEAEIDMDIDACGELTLDIALLWTETDLGVVEWDAAYEVSGGLTLAVSARIDCLAEQLDAIGISVAIEW